MKVLIVDDSLLAEHALKSYFIKLGHIVVGLAKNGNLAKKMYNLNKPDIVTVDAVMPGISGVEFVQWINQQDKDNQTNTLVYMISSDEISEPDQAKIKADGYIIKPVTLNKIRAILSG